MPLREPDKFSETIGNVSFHYSVPPKPRGLPAIDRHDKDAPHFIPAPPPKTPAPEWCGCVWPLASGDVYIDNARDSRWDADHPSETVERVRKYSTEPPKEHAVLVRRDRCDVSLKVREREYQVVE